MGTGILDSFVEKSNALSLYGIVVRQRGDVIAQHHFQEQKRRTQYSVSKTFTSIAVGMAISEGLFRLEDTVAQYFAGEYPIEMEEAWNKVTLRDLLIMGVGQDKPYLLGDTRDAVKGSWVRFALSGPIVCEPGRRFQYTNVGAFLSGVIIQRMTGGNLVDYLMPRLFEPLGIERPWWEQDPERYTFGAAGLEITVEELARMGQVLLDGGCYGNRRLLPAQWVEEASKKHIETAGFTDNLADNNCGYGYQLWRGQHDTYRADGSYGQYCIVIPDRDAVVAVNANETNRQGILDLIWQEILPRL